MATGQLSKKARAEVTVVGVMGNHGKIQSKAAVGPLGCYQGSRGTPQMIHSPLSQMTKPAAEQINAIPEIRI